MRYKVSLLRHLNKQNYKPNNALKKISHLYKPNNVLRKINLYNI